MDILRIRDENADHANREMVVLTSAEMFSLLYFLYLKFRGTYDKRLVQKKHSIVEYFFEAFMKNVYFALRMDDELDEIFDLVLAGSAAEGTFNSKSDVDIMLVWKCLKCCEPSCTEIYNRKRKGVFIADRVNASPGYSLLLGYNSSFPGVTDNKIRKVNLQTCGEFQKAISNRYFKRMFIIYLKIFLRNICEDTFLEKPVQQLLESGPAINLEIYLRKLSRFLSFDRVFAIPYEDRTLLKSWVERKRRYGWPSQELISEISKMPCHLVPVGRKGSQLEEYEWRICYIFAERQLMRSLNEVQLMLYQSIKVQCKSNVKCVSSYIIKNLILWLAETLPQHCFQEKYYFALEYATMAALVWCVKNGKLPCYMIPERNLIADKLTGSEKQTILKQLREYLPNYRYCPFSASSKKIGCTILTTELLNICENLKESERVLFLKQYQNTIKTRLKMKYSVLKYSSILNNPGFTLLIYSFRLCHMTGSRLPDVFVGLLAGCIKVYAKQFARTMLKGIYDHITSRLYGCIKNTTVRVRRKVPVTAIEVSLAVISFWLHITTI
ncbi:uncharacterized protein LOC123555661 [Mercenaria mercenaria]|uniref:uncharacterized protein LOC123555661 n=1 Tax=Mercenaria mercenaria TaxID=6596 RepID=UPI00234EDAEF|nr:uncharacterized protein LOC123555661 [Mercenaria mercenaria]